MSKLLNQWRKPTGRLGRAAVWAMNISHSKLTDWGLKHVAIEKHWTILDVGCGGGMTVHKLAGTVTEGKVYGIDFSEERSQYPREPQAVDKDGPRRNPTRFCVLLAVLRQHV